MNFHNFGDSQWQNFIYLLLIFVVLLSGLFLRRDLPFSKALKYLGIWSVIGLVGVIIYSYRFEFSDFKNKIMGEINPASIQIPTSGELIINLAQDGHFYMDVKVNGTPIRFMIDTGASDIVISLEEAERIGININELAFTKLYQTANGKSWGANITFDELQVGNVKFRNVPASVNKSSMGTALLGMSFLRQFKKYEFYRDKLVLTI